MFTKNVMLDTNTKTTMKKHMTDELCKLNSALKNSAKNLLYHYNQMTQQLRQVSQKHTVFKSF